MNSCSVALSRHAAQEAERCLPNKVLQFLQLTILRYTFATPALSVCLRCSISSSSFVTRDAFHVKKPAETCQTSSHNALTEWRSGAFSQLDTLLCEARKDEKFYRALYFRLPYRYTRGASFLLAILQRLV